MKLLSYSFKKITITPGVTYVLSMTGGRSHFLGWKIHILQIIANLTPTILKNHNKSHTEIEGY